MSQEIIYRLHHFGLLCQDMQNSMQTYQDQLGGQLTSRWYNRGLLDISFLGRGNDATLELVSAAISCPMRKPSSQSTVMGLTI